MILLLAAAGLVSTFACSKDSGPGQQAAPDPTVISAYTAGVISRASSVKVQFTTTVAGEDQVGTELTPSPFSFSPRIRGAAYRADTRILEYRPLKELEPGRKYTATLHLDRVVETRGKELSFTFSVMRQSFSIQADGLRTPDSTDLRHQELHGTVGSR